MRAWCLLFAPTGGTRASVPRGMVRERAVSRLWGHRSQQARRIDRIGYARQGASRGIYAAARGSPPPKVFRLAPSDFAFLYDTCPRCFYLKSHKMLMRPKTFFPSVFNDIDNQMKEFFAGVRTQDVVPEMRPGVFLCDKSDPWLQSAPIDVPGHSSKVVISGKVDCLVQFDDDKTFGIVDFKTSNQDTSNSKTSYERQLHAYALCLQNLSGGKEKSLKISDLALIVYQPQLFVGVRRKAASPSDPQRREIGGRLDGNLKYVPLERDDTKFMRFLSEVLDILELPAPPPPPPQSANYNSGCPFCSYLVEGQASGHIPLGHS
ncbi:hypothetical protein FVE85_4934 [Porphyridium purpureum]|uniref:PD-(D/E)XK endonuclease-like domain-containing protein n=1 Tax=Porphyridium purpureum TaxID=35688 RepID=A0A5J4YTQ4_PORPP|nr:hypothetical protein FVE85_4934 [Porphyridium purpureum]|eukprot:POR1975..scf236_6